MKCVLCLLLSLFCCNVGGNMKHGVRSRNMCKMPRNIENGRYTLSNRYVDGTLTYSCDDGYRYTGSNTHICQADGQWTGIFGNCEEVHCPELPVPHHGTLRYSGYGYNDTAHVVCDDGFVFSTPEHNLRICQQNNNWSPQTGDCQDIMCPWPKPPKSGSLCMTPPYINGTVTFTCKEGYNYTGTTTRVCQPTGQWNGTEGVCADIQCKSLPTLENGNASLISGRRYGSNATLHCNPGFTLHGSGVIVCQSNGKWSPNAGTCRKKPNYKLLLLLLVLPLIVVLIGCLWLWRLFEIRRVKMDNLDTERGAPLIESIQGQRCRMYFSFILNEKFTAGKSDPHSDEYSLFASRTREKVKDAIQGISGGNLKVIVDCISEQKQTVFVRIESIAGDIEDPVAKALYSLHDKGRPFIRPGSISVKDEETAALAIEIIKQKHVKDTNLDRRVDLETQYVRLKIVSKEDMGIVSRDEMEVPDKYQAAIDKQDTKDITDEDIITPNKTQQCVVIRGRAGIGKTTLMQRLMWRWACGEWATHLKAIFLLNLRLLASIQGDLDMPHILSLCSVYKVAHYGHGLQAKWLMDNEEKIGFVLDGLDELHNFKALWDGQTVKYRLQQETGPLNWCCLLMKRLCLPKSTLIITSRPFKGLNSLTSSSTIEVMGLTRERVMEFINKNVNKQNVTHVKQTMIKRPILMSVSAITFYCAALCSILQDEIGVTEKLVTYTQITAYITTMFLKRSLKSSEGGEIPSQSLRAMCQLAYNGLLERTGRGLAQLVFEEQDLQNMTAGDVKWARRSGLFLQTEVPALKYSNKKLLGEFVHLSIQEFLAMAGLLMMTPEKIEEALTLLKTSGQFNMALLFLYGFAFDNKHSSIQQLNINIGGRLDVEQEVQSHLQDMICNVSDKLQLLQMVYESQSPQIAQHVGQHKFKEEVHFSGTKMTVVDVMALTFLLQHKPNTKTITLQDVGLDSLCLKELSDFLKTNDTVTRLTLGDEGIDDAGVEYVSQALKLNTRLPNLFIGSNNVTDRGVTSLADLLHTNTTLNKLRIVSDKVTDQGVASLVDVLHTNATLQHLKKKRRNGKLVSGHNLRMDGAISICLQIN